LIGGLITATALTLLLVPVLYDRLALPRAERRRLADLERDVAGAPQPEMGPAAAGPGHTATVDRGKPVELPSGELTVPDGGR
ncbi:hypothetical protein ABTM21_20165, partial [Acinetobacter baumannii]